MRVKTLIQGVRKYTFALKKLSREIGVSKLYLYLDCMISYILYGCVLNQYIEGRFYLKRFFDRKRIFTYRKWKRVLRFNDPNYVHILKDKVEFNHFFSGFIGREWLCSKDILYEDFILFLKRHGACFLKPNGGLEGAGCQVVYFNENEDYTDFVNDLRKKDYLIEEVVRQHDDMIFGNESVNTIRVYTIYNEELNKAIAFKTTLRVGVGKSIVDNSHAGGVSYEIDIPTGRIDSRGWGHVYNDVLVHPLTDICMMGRKIPYWEEVVKMCELSAMKIPKIRYIGWDVAIKNDGPLLIEGNHIPDLDIMEFVGNYGYWPVIKSHLNL